MDLCVDDLLGLVSQFPIIMPTSQEDIKKLQGHSHSLMADTVSYELRSILTSTEVCAL